MLKWVPSVNDMLLSIGLIVSGFWSTCFIRIIYENSEFYNLHIYCSTVFVCTAICCLMIFGILLGVATTSIVYKIIL